MWCQGWICNRYANGVHRALQMFSTHDHQRSDLWSIEDGEAGFGMTLSRRTVNHDVTGGRQGDATTVEFGVDVELNAVDTGLHGDGTLVTEEERVPVLASYPSDERICLVAFFAWHTGPHVDHPT